MLYLWCKLQSSKGNVTKDYFGPISNVTRICSRTVLLFLWCHFSNIEFWISGLLRKSLVQRYLRISSVYMSNESYLHFLRDKQKDFWTLPFWEFYTITFFGVRRKSEKRSTKFYSLPHHFFLPTRLYLLLPSPSFQERSQLCFFFNCHLLHSKGSLNALGQRLSENSVSWYQR